MQHLMVDSYSANDSFQTVLSSCPNVRNLALYLPTTWEVSRVEAELNSLLFVLQNMPRLTRLSVSLPTRSMSYADLLIRPFLNLTHVEILFPSASSHSWGKCDILTQSPKLTHLSIEGTIQVHDVLKLLHRPRLKVLIVVPSDRGRQDLDALYRVEDNRLVLLEELNYVDVIFDWEKGANGGVDTWMFAELVAFARASE